MTLNELMNEIRKLLPNASIGEDIEGQIIIYTDKVLGKGEKLEDLVLE